MTANPAPYTTLPYPRTRQLMVDGGQLGIRQHTVHGLVEFDVSLARAAIRQHKEETGESRSFTAFFLACLGKAIETNKHMHAYRNWRNQVIIFDEVDVNTLFEVDVDGKKMIRPHILRAVNKKTMQDLHQEIRSFQRSEGHSFESASIDRFVKLPTLVRRLALRALFASPSAIKTYYGTVLVSSIGMFGEGSGWGIPVPNHTLQLTLGGIDKKPGVVGGSIEIREYLNVTISINHDIVDGAPAARFTQRLKALVESGDGLVD